ncbi:hypothetical protein ATCCBAA256_07180 [Mycobacterium montefiorense]|nr:hypothetical protein ATCCBAA256_07180 [Mycobacterium montefiorense]
MTREIPTNTTQSAPTAIAARRIAQPIIGTTNASSASQPAIVSNACPDGNDVWGTGTSMVDGRGRFASPLAASDTNPFSMPQATNSSAARTLRRSNATTAATVSSSRSGSGPSQNDTASQNRTHAGCLTATSCEAFSDDQSIQCSQPQFRE